MDFDYKALGLKCGLEVHQQLDTGKLFSRTLTKLRDDKADFRVKRYLRPVASELGEMDRAALEAFNKGLYYLYEGHHDTISLVELDEEPPQPLDRDAFNTILEVALMLESRIVDEIFVMRKAVIDGSNTSGFQRTMLIATGGSVKLGSKELGIQTIVLEEDSARPTEKTEQSITYRLDRLGIPLIEMATEPGIETPEEAKEAALSLGTLLRRTCRVKRGLGTIRQDLNISIANGARTEIKGVQDLELIDEYVRREAQRQVKLLGIKTELGKRSHRKEEIVSEGKDIGSIFQGTACNILKNSLSEGEAVLGLRLPKFSSLLGTELQPGRRLGTELADKVRATTGLKGLFHSDELPAYGISEDEVARVKQELGCKPDDAFVIIAGQKQKTWQAIRAVAERAEQCSKGVPEETRAALEGGNTEYLRPLPGSARMYPETDLDTIIVDEKELKRIKSSLPLTEREREKLYSKWGLNAKHVSEMKLSNYARLFESTAKKGADAKRTAVFLLETLTQAKRNGAQVENLSEKTLEELLTAISSGKIHREIQEEIITKKCENPSLSVEQMLASRGMATATSREVARVVRETVSKNSSLVKQHGLRAVGPLMGDAMAKLRGKASGKEVSEALKKEINRHGNP